MIGMFSKHGKWVFLVMVLLLLPMGVLSAQQTAPAPEAVQQNDLLNATLWVTTSVEYKGNSIGMYQLGRFRLDQALKDENWTAALEQTGHFQKLPPAIILDVDETVLDNGAYESWLIKAGKDYSSKTWNLWVEAAQGTPIPGALEFLKYAASKGVTIFYVSNRTGAQEPATRKNLQALGFPMGDGKVDTFLFTKEEGHPDWTSAKGTRRAYIAQKYRILLLFGDNYGDFSDDASMDLAGRLETFDANMAHVGHDWIFIANPEYGSFESAPFKNNYSLSPDQRREMKIDALPVWEGAPQ